MPQINNHEVLVKVKAAGVNPLDILNLNGSVRMIADYKLPLTLGNELSGVIEAVGDDVLNFKVGDPVYTRLPLNKIGAFAEYAAVNEDALSIMPENLSFIEAAAVPLTALTAYQALHDVLHVQPNKSYSFLEEPEDLALWQSPLPNHWGYLLLQVEVKEADHVQCRSGLISS